MKRIKMLILALAVVTAASAQSLRLPSQHNAAHDNLLANQRPMTSELHNAASQRLEQELIRLEDAADVYNHFWTSDRVNPYGNSVTIPNSKEIDVRGFVMPLDRINVSSRYGYRPQFGRMHRGVDLTLKVGDTVRAACDGKVRLTKFDANGYGYYVVVRHPNGMETVYGHLSKFLVRPNQIVKAGEPIALGGNTGRSTGPHLHFETRYLGLAVNPEGIYDFGNKTTHKDFYSFSRANYEQSQNYGPARAQNRNNTRVSQGSRRSSAASSNSRRRSRRR